MPGLQRFRSVSSLKIPSDLNSIIKVSFQAFLEGNNTSVSWLFGYSYLQEALIDKFVIVSCFFFARVKNVHLQC